MPRRRIGWLIVGSSVWMAACSGDDEGPAPSPLVIEKASPSGDAQTGPVGTTLANPLRVVITRDGEPVPEVEVDWATDQGLLGEAQESDEDGIASAVWTLGPDEGEQTATATVEDAEGSPLTFTATATQTSPPPAAEVQVLNNSFEPDVITVTAGQRVIWVWESEEIGVHNVAPDEQHPARSGNPETGPHTYSYTFDQVGTFQYYCEVHGDVNGVGMSGRVIVEAAP
jgi:plastocyanin